MKKFLIISFVCLLFSCQNTSKEIIENSKTETEVVTVGQIPENIITKKKPNTDEVIDIQIRWLKKNSSDYDFLKDIWSIKELKNFMETYVLPEDIEDREIHFYVNEKFLIGLWDNIDYYSREIMEKIFSIFSTREDILEYSTIFIDRHLLYDLDISFLKNLKVR